MVKFEFFPYDDMSEYQIILQTPPGSSLEYTDKVVSEIESEVSKLEGIKETFTTIGGDNSAVTNASIYLNLYPLQERKEDQHAIMRKTREIIKKYPGLRPSVQYVGTISGGGFKRTTFNTVFQGPDVDKLNEYTTEMIKELSKHKGFVDLDTAQPDVSPEVKVEIDRDKASDLGVQVYSVASALRTMIGGQKVANFKEGTEQYDVRLRLDEDYRKSIDNVNALPIKTNNGYLVRLENLANVYEGRSPSQIDHYNMEREMTVISNLEDLALGDAKKIAEQAIKKLDLPSDYRTYPIGLGKLLDETAYNFMIATILSIIFIYIVLAAQFDSFTQPLIIMSSIPLAVPFGLLSLYIFDQSLNIDSMIGMLLLFGIVKKNAILQVDYTNTLVAQGKPIKEAVIEADHARLRPILMTTLTIIAGMLPIALGKGDGSAARATMGTVIIGGQALCLGITLIVVPVLYTLREDVKQFSSRYFRIFKSWLSKYV